MIYLNMIKISYFLLIFLIESAICEINYCGEKQSENCCYISNTTTINVDNNEIKWDLLDKESGQLEIVFPLKEKIEKYKLYLFVTEIKDNSQCSESFITQWEVTEQDNWSRFLHTKLDYKITDDDNCTICESELRVSFDHIFTGCYFLNISMEPPVAPPLLSYFQFIETNYEKMTAEDIYNSNPIGLNAITTEDSVVLTLPNLFLNEKNTLKIGVNCTKDNVCPKFGNGSLDNYAYMPKNQTLKKKYELEICRIDRTEVDGFETNIDDPKCTYNNYSNDGNVTLECFYTLPSGQYSFEFSLVNDIRCPPYDSLWGNGSYCRWHFNGNVEKRRTFISYFDLEDNFLTTVHYSLIMGSIILIILIIVVVFIIKCNRNNYTSRPTFNDSEDNDDDIESRSKVFLLYARDCHQFMDTMEAFRTVLRYEGQFEIFDIYDNCLFNTIVLNPEAWIQDKLTTCKVVLILTECAEKIHENCQNTKTLYKLPQPLDNNFLYALRNINQSVAINNYKNLYIVQFSYDHSDYKTFSFLTPYTRYYLPNNFTKLFNDLKDENINSIEITSDKNFESALAYKLFLKKYKIYEDYVKKRPYYLEEIVNLQPDE